MVITSDSSQKLVDLYKHLKETIDDIEKKEIEGDGRGVVYELLTNEVFMTALVAIAGYANDSFKAWLVYKTKTDDKQEKIEIDAEIMDDPTTEENQAKIEEMTKDKEDVGLHIEFKE